MSDTMIGAVASVLIALITSCSGFGLVCKYGTEFVIANRELMRDSVIDDYTRFADKKEIPRIKRESIDRKMEGIRNMKPSVSDATLEDIYSEIRKWKII